MIIDLTSSRQKPLLAGLVALLLIVLGMGPALAQWQVLEATLGTGATVYGLRAELDADHFLQFSCSGGKTEIALVDRDGQGPHVYEGTSVDYVFVMLSTDTGGTWTSPGDFAANPDGSLTLAYRNSGDAAAMLAGIVAAKAEISVSMIQSVTGTEDIYRAGAKGSTAAGKAFIDKCGMAPTPAATPATTGGKADWTLQMLPDPNHGGSVAALYGVLEGERYLYASCDSQKVAVLALAGADLPYEQGAVGLSLQVEIDGSERTATGEVLGDADGTTGVAYVSDQPAYLESLIRALATAQASVSMRIVDYSDGSDVSWRSIGLAGLADAAAGFIAHCYDGATVTTVAAPIDVAAPTEWSFSQSVADVTAGYRGVMTGRVSADRSLRLTCSVDGGVWTIGVFDAQLAGQGSASLAIDIEGLPWELPAAAAESGFVASDGSAVPELVTVLSLPRQSILVEVVQDGRRTPYRFTAGEAAASAALEMFRKCYALG